ncbi:MAG: LysR family transcriptional regulator [Caulobacterales bacterium]|nr:LysR family transcriptional regulator [Caulobacterales bacterium]
MAAEPAGLTPRPGSDRRLVIEVRHLKLVQAIAREGSVTRAARWLNLTQSALSHQLLNLERDLGAQLFDRVGKRMAATAAGAKLVATAETVLATLAEAELGVRRFAEARQPLRVAAGCFSYYTWLSAALARFAAERPLIDVQVGLQGTRREVQALLADEVDLAITSQPPADERLERCLLFELEVVALIGEGHRLITAGATDGRGVRWSELRGETILTHELADADLVRLRTALGRETKIWPVQLNDAIFELARAGQGVGVVTGWPHLLQPQPGLRCMSLAPAQHRTFWAVWRRGNPRALPMHELASHLTRDIGAPVAAVVHI